jgi:hypothetical protein
MNELGIKRLLRELGADMDTVFDTGRGWINCACPLAPWTHGGGVDTRPSFGVSISEESSSVYFCFGCSEEVRSLKSLLHAAFILTQRFPFEASRIYLREEIHTEDGEERVVYDWHGEGQQEDAISAKPLPPEVLRRFPLLEEKNDAEARKIKKWITEDRKISEWVQKLYRLRYDYHRKSVVFPMTDKAGEIYVLRERQRGTKNIWTVTPKIAGFPDLCFSRLRQVGAWFGMRHVNWDKRVMLVEGEFDAMRIASLGFPNVIASATSSVTDAQIEWLKGSAYILGYDEDKGGRHATRRIAERFQGKVALYIAPWSIVDCKDGGDLKERRDLEKVLSNLEKP